MDRRASAPGPPLRLRRTRRAPLLLATAALVLAACGRGEGPQPALGPHDGHHLPPTDTGRVAVGDVAPNFTLASLADGVLTLSGFRGSKDVVLVFYRGHW